MAKVYLSSTYEDLRDEREAVYRALRKLRHDVVAMEDYVAADARPLEKCLSDVAESDIYVGLFGWRYGYKPPGQDKSITELEFRQAVKCGKKCLIFLQAEAIKPGTADSDDSYIKALRAELARDYLFSTFTSPADLAVQAIASVADLFGDLSRALGKADVPLERVIEMVKEAGETSRLAPAEVAEETDHLQRDALNWISDVRYLRTAELRLAEARRLIADAIQRNPQSGALLTARGYVEKTFALVLKRKDDVAGAAEAQDAAARCFRAALELNPSDVSALNGQQNILLLQGEYGKAAVLGRVITGYQPDYAAAFWDLSIALEQMFEPSKPDPQLAQELAEVFETLTRLIPNDPSGFTPADLARVQEKAGRYRKLAKSISDRSGRSVRSVRSVRSAKRRGK